jgi:hypothetical protein
VRRVRQRTDVLRTGQLLERIDGKPRNRGASSFLAVSRLLLDNGAMRRLTLLAVVALVGAAVPAQGQTASRSVVLHFTIFQQATHRHVHPPAGDAGDSYSTKLILTNAVAQMGKAVGGHEGSMDFAYTLSGSCAGGGGCTGTTDIQTLTHFLDGTITAASKNVPLGKRPFVVKVISGTGAYKGVTGRVEIAPKGDPKTDYFLTLP